MNGERNTQLIIEERYYETNIDSSFVSDNYRTQISNDH